MDPTQFSDHLGMVPEIEGPLEESFFQLQIGEEDADIVEAEPDLSAPNEGLGTLIRLPLEIRRQVYRKVLSSNKPIPAITRDISIDWITQNSNVRRTSIANLLCTSRQIHAEFQDVLDDWMNEHEFQLVLSEHGVAFEGMRSRQIHNCTCGCMMVTPLMRRRNLWYGGAPGSVAESQWVLCEWCVLNDSMGPEENIRLCTALRAFRRAMSLNARRLHIRVLIDTALRTASVWYNTLRDKNTALVWKILTVVSAPSNLRISLEFSHDAYRYWGLETSPRELFRDRMWLPPYLQAMEVMTSINSFHNMPHLSTLKFDIQRPIEWSHPALKTLWVRTVQAFWYTFHMLSFEIPPRAMTEMFQVVLHGTVQSCDGWICDGHCTLTTEQAEQTPTGLRQLLDMAEEFSSEHSSASYRVPRPTDDQAQAA